MLPVRSTERGIGLHAGAGNRTLASDHSRRPGRETESAGQILQPRKMLPSKTHSFVSGAHHDRTQRRPPLIQLCWTQGYSIPNLRHLLLRILHRFGLSKIAFIARFEMCVGLARSLGNVEISTRGRLSLPRPINIRPASRTRFQRLCTLFAVRNPTGEIGPSGDMNMLCPAGWDLHYTAVVSP